MYLHGIAGSHLESEADKRPDPREVLRIKSELIDQLKQRIDELVAAGVPLSQIELLPATDQTVLFVGGAPHTEFRLDADGPKILTLKSSDSITP